MRIENDKDFLKERFSIVGGNITGIWDKNTFFVGDTPYPLPNINYITANLVNVTQIVYKDKLDIMYHLSGYGSTNLEARVSFLGESSERYAFSMMPLTLKKNIITSSYNKLVAKYGESSVLPLKYVNIFKEVKGLQKIMDDDIIAWVKCQSLLEPNSCIFEPLQYIMFNPIHEKKYNVSAVSTGTASHENIGHALQNALIEYLQIDSYNLWWYGGHVGRKLKVDLDLLFKKYLNTTSRKFLEKFKVNFTDISFDKSIWIVACEIEGINQLPRYIVGLQGSFSLERAIYRSLLECLTVLAYSINLSWLKPDLLKNIQENINKMDNLDLNVGYYTMYSKPKLASNSFLLKNKLEKSKNLKELIKDNRELFEWSGFINITPCEFANLQLNVIRVFAPKLLPISMPSYPPKNHPRYNATGGIVNYVEHPMA